MAGEALLDEATGLFSAGRTEGLPAPVDCASEVAGVVVKLNAGVAGDSGLVTAVGSGLLKTKEDSGFD